MVEVSSLSVRISVNMLPVLVSYNQDEQCHTVGSFQMNYKLHVVLRSSPYNSKIVAYTTKSNYETFDLETTQFSLLSRKLVLKCKIQVRSLSVKNLLHERPK